tara:strand:+ start:2289 stop:2933 length:645 start_codon:yes stop_codon:yes gene_type:complete
MEVFKKCGYGIFYALALGVSIYAILFVTVDWVGSEYLKEKFSLTPLAMYLHMVGGSIALTIGAFQLNSRMRAKSIKLHRTLGKVYVTAVLLSGSAGLYLATNSMGGIVAHFGFGTMAILWLFTVSMAFVQIKKGNVNAHRYWMIINYSLTCSAITLRLYLPSFPWLFNVDFITSYIAISWVAWVPNVLVAQLYLLKTKRVSYSVQRTIDNTLST